jgi:hypothetical protein
VPIIISPALETSLPSKYLTGLITPAFNPA